MAFNFLYNQDEDENKGVFTDTVHLIGFINDFAASLGIDYVDVDMGKCRSVLTLVRQDFPHCDGIEAASPFKKIAYFLCFFVSERPINSEFPDATIGNEFSTIGNHTNTIMAFEIALEALHGAKLQRKDGEFILKNKIALSNHSYVDIIEALSRITPVAHFSLVSVLLEQLAYKTNPDCQYSELE